MKKKYKILYNAGGAFGQNFAFFDKGFYDNDAENSGFESEAEAVAFIHHNRDKIPSRKEGFHFIIVPVVTVFTKEKK